MNKRFTESLPPELVTHVTEGCGAAGERWLENLPAIINRLEHLWSLTVKAPFAGIEYNYVAPAIVRGSANVVIKIAPPWDTVEIYGEAAWLRCREGNCVVELLAEDRDSRAILIEQAFPGESLTEYFTAREPESVGPAIDVLSATLRPASEAKDDFVFLDRWFDGLRRYTSKDFPHAYAEKALTIYETLAKQPGKTHYLHGDFHPGNIVRATRAPFLAIDPKGVVGHIGYEIAVFLNNFHWWQEQKPDIRTLIDAAVHQFATAFDMPPVELRLWAYAQMVLGAWWTYDEMPEIYNNEVVKADIWDV